MAHSLVRDHLDLLNGAATGRFHVNVVWNMESGESTHRFMRDLPPEEEFESLAVRLRPFVMRKESVYWASILDSVEKLLSKETLDELVDIQSLRDYWAETVEGKKVAQAFYVLTDKGQLSDVELADLWLNSDSLHTQPIQSDVGKDMSLNHRYQAAAGVYSRIGACMEYTLFWVTYLAREGLIALDESVFTDQVIAESKVDEPTKAYCVPLGGAPMPTDLAELDLSKWKPVHEDPELMALVQGKIKAAKDVTPEAS